MRLQNLRLILLLIIINLIGNTLHLGAQLSVAGRWQCTGTGLEAETISFRLELKQSGSNVSGFWIIGNDEVPIREGKLQDNHIELITFADDKQFTSVATVEGDEMKGTWKDDTGVREAGKLSVWLLTRNRRKLNRVKLIINKI